MPARRTRAWVRRYRENDWWIWKRREGLLVKLRLADASAGQCSDEGERWPWGPHSTVLLEALADAACEFWALYDPADPSTAPADEYVTQWLVGRHVPKRVAATMTLILRADGLSRPPAACR